MFCGTCGSKLPDNAKFCEECGAVVQENLPEKEKAAPRTEPFKPVLKVPPKEPKPPKPKKERKPIKINYNALAAVAIVLIIAVAAAIVYPVLFPNVETVYVLASYTYTSADGEVTVYEIDWDAEGNPTYYYDPFMYYQIEAEYDEYGNLTQKTQYRQSDDMEYETDFTYEYTYNDDGLIRSCKEYQNGEKTAEWDYTWDDQGRLTQIILSDGYAPYVRAEWEYDEAGRLITEYAWQHIYGFGPENSANWYQVIRTEYFYDENGNLESYQCCSADEPLEDYEDENPEDLDFKTGNIVYYDFTYDEAGNVLTYETNRGGEVTEHEFTYDENGNLERDCYIYDENGNLIRIESESGVIREYEYEAVEMSPEAAQNYYRWESLLHLDPEKKIIYPIYSMSGLENQFYYYLIPNPIW